METYRPRSNYRAKAAHDLAPDGSPGGEYLKRRDADKKY
jgi:hypothetical protein